MPDRSILFVDGNNWYHSLKEAGVTEQIQLDYAKISSKLVGPRDWLGTRYYIGRLSQSGNSRLYADQRRFLSLLENTDPRISTHLGRIELRKYEENAARELHAYLGSLRTRIDPRIFKDLMSIAKKHRRGFVHVEKAVDVMLAVDMVTMAVKDEYDTAYLLSADGDYTPAVESAREEGKNVFAASPGFGRKLAGVVNSYIRLTPDWFDDCYR